MTVIKLHKGKYICAERQLQTYSKQGKKPEEWQVLYTHTVNDV